MKPPQTMKARADRQGFALSGHIACKVSLLQTFQITPADATILQVALPAATTAALLGLLKTYHWKLDKA